MKCGIKKARIETENITYQLNEYFSENFPYKLYSSQSGFSWHTSHLIVDVSHVGKYRPISWGPKYNREQWLKNLSVRTLN